MTAEQGGGRVFKPQAGSSSGAQVTSLLLRDSADARSRRSAKCTTLPQRDWPVPPILSSSPVVAPPGAHCVCFRAKGSVEHECASISAVHLRHHGSC